MCQLLSPNSHGCNHSCFCVPEEIGMFTAFQCSRKETMASEMQTCSHVWKCMGRAQKCAQTCVFTLRQRGCQREQAENVFAGRKCDWRGGIWNHTEAEDKVCVCRAEGMAAAFLFQGWARGCEGESAPTLLGLGWGKLHMPCVLCTRIIEADKARRKVLCSWRNTPQYLQSLTGASCSETLLCSVKLMLQAGWKALNGDRNFLRGNTKCGGDL